MDRLECKAPLKSPLHASFWVADNCNLSCRYCYADPFSGRMMDTKRFIQIVDEMVELEVPDITVSGGEPFLHPDIFFMIEYMVKKKIRPAVLTNGTLLNAKAIEKLSAIDGIKNNMMLQISIDSTDSSINDFTRGQGKTVLKNIKLLAENNFFLQISTVLSRKNIDTAHLIIDAIYPLVKRFHFLCIQRTHKALENPEILVSQKQLDQFWWRLKEHASKFPDDLFLPSLRIALRASNLEDSLKDREFHQTATLDCPSCTAGLTHVNIDVDFNVLGCDIAKDYTKMGNVREKSFKEVWHSSRAHDVRNSPFPLCYKIKNKKGESLQSRLKSEAEYRNSDTALALNI